MRNRQLRSSVLWRACTAFLLGALLIGILAGCGDTIERTPDGKIKVVATTMQIADFLANVGGDKLAVTTIMKEGVNHHTYEPAASDIRSISEAQMIFTVGVGLEDWLPRLIETSGTQAVQVVTSEGIRPLDLQHRDHVHPFGDPHVWHNTMNAQQMVTNIAAGLAAFDSRNKSLYEANAQSYNAQLDALAQEIQAMIDTIPPERRKLVTSHEAFGYFARQFGLKRVGNVIIASETSDPSSQQVIELIRKIREEQVPAIFTETSLDSRLAEQIAKEAGVKVVTNLYSDSLSAPGGEADTYIKMMRVNAQTIVAGLS